MTSSFFSGSVTTLFTGLPCHPLALMELLDKIVLNSVMLAPPFRLSHSLLGR